MLRAILLAGPFVLVAVVSCGDSSATFDDITGGSAGTGATVADGSQAGTNGEGGNSATAGSAASNGGSSNAGQGSGNGGSNKGGQSTSNGGTGNAGTANNGGTKNNAGSANNGGTASQAGSAGRGGTSSGGTATDPGGAANAGAAGSDAGAAGMAGMAGSGPTDPQCPDVFGSYKVKSKDGMCSGINKDAPQSIEGDTDACTGHFVSDPPTGPAGVNGAASIDADGNFTGAMLSLDKTQRSPCTGEWNPQDATMTVTCGGQADMCTVVLELQ